MWFTFVATIPLYVFMGETTRFSWLSSPVAGKILVSYAALDVLCFSWALRKRYIPALESLRSQTENTRDVVRWKGGWLIAFCSAINLILVGLALRLGGRTLQQSLPFCLVGILLTLWLWPRQVGSSSSPVAH
jgi:hypothetical protein